MFVHSKDHHILNKYLRAIVEFDTWEITLGPTLVPQVYAVVWATPV